MTLTASWPRFFPRSITCALYKENAEDLNRMYARSFLLYKGEPVLIEGFQSDEEAELYVVFMPEKATRFMTEKWVSGMFTEPQIVNGYYNTGDTNSKKTPLGYVYNRLPRRQYRRGLCQDNSELSSVCYKIYTLFGLYRPEDSYIEDFKVIRKLLNPVYPGSVAEAVELVKDHGIVALCRELALCLSPSTPDDILILNRNGHFVGKLEGTIIRVHFHPMLQEVKDAVFRNNMGLAVDGA